jgi:regulator of protease activity HflC (stomatin/prohibitin superfamily)
METGEIGDYKEKALAGINGWCLLVFNLLLTISIAAGYLGNAILGMWYLAVIATLLIPVSIIFWCGLLSIEPNMCYVCTFCGKYMGTVRNAGYRFVNPFYSKTKLSLRVKNFETSRIKVNDSIGNPIEIQAVICWRILDSAAASFEVGNY